MKIEKIAKVVAILRDIVIIFGILAFTYWLFFVPEPDDLYYYEYEDIPEENTGVDV